jgi:hypothetical protein
MHKPRFLVLIAALLVVGAVPPLAAFASTGAPRTTSRMTPGTQRTAGSTFTEKPTVKSAVRTVKSPAEPGLSLGLSGAVSQLAAGSPSSIASWQSRAQSVGAQIVRLNITWSSIAPTTPPAGFDASSESSAGYDWTTVDQQVRQLTSEGFKVLIEVQGAPTWAEGADKPASVGAGTWEPNSVAFGQFATALATRYDGQTPDPLEPGQNLPRVSDWQAWNEPNLTEYLAPQWLTSGSTEIPESTVYYRNLENAFYASVKAVSSSNFVVAAGTAPYGDPPGGARMQPVTFDQNLLCLNSSDQPSASCPGPTYMDAIDDHPYVSGLCCEGPTWHAELAADTSIADMYKIVDVLKAAKSAGTVAPAGAKSVWASEIGWNTDPPNPNSNEASPAALVGKWATQALYILWSQGVNTVLWYQLADDPENSAGWAATYTEGLYYIDGTAKPAAAAFAFPFLTNRKTKRTVEAWGRSPRAGLLFIQKKSGSQWVSVLKLKVKTDQVFQAPVALSGSGSFRAVIGGSCSPAWSQSP